jgi:hypothetical protein
VFFPHLLGKYQGKTRKDGARPALFHISCYLCCSMYCLCVNVYCHRVTTQLWLINISYQLHKQFYHDFYIQGKQIDSFHHWGNSSWFQLHKTKFMYVRTHCFISWLNPIWWNLSNTWCFVSSQIFNSHLNVRGTGLRYKWLPFSSVTKLGQGQ